jgi:chemotaxis protein methyltransferase CheR
LAHFALGNIARSRGRDREADKHFSVALRLSARYRDDEILPESDGITAGRFAQMIRSLMKTEVMV